LSSHFRATGRTLSRFAIAAALSLAFSLASTATWAQQTPSASTSQRAKPAPKAAVETPPSPPGISYSTTLDRTAVWVGDQFHYLITVDYSSQYEFVLDNLNQQNVNMDPFPVIDVAKTVTPLGNGKNRLLLDITLSSFALTQTDARIPQLSLYYFQHDQHAGGPEQAAAESLTVLGPTIGLRSTLPPMPADIRDSVSVTGWERARWIVPAVGYITLAILLAWLGWETFLFVKKRRIVQGPDRRISMKTVRARWASAVPADFSDSQTTMEFFDRSYQDVKEYLGYYLETDTVSLTAEEVKEEMKRFGASSDVTQKAAKVLGTCEAVRYSEDGMASSAESARSIAQDVRELLALAPKD
jgi:hypothetical protein